VALQYLLYGDFSNPFRNPLHPGGGPLTWHGWLYPYALSRIGGLFSVQTMPGMEVVESAIVVVSAALLALKIAPLPISGWVKVAAFVCAVGVLQALSGRPEVIAQLLLIVWLLVYPLRSAAASDGLSAIVLGAIAAAQPTVAVLGGLLFCTYLCFAFETRRALLSIVRVGVVSAAFALLITWLFYPWSLGALASGLLEQARHVARRSDGDFWGIYVFSLSTPFVIAWLAMLVALGALLWRRRAVRPKSILFYPLLAVSIYGVWAFGMRVSYTWYNIGVFFPLVIYTVLLALGDERIRPFGKVASVVVLGLGALTLLAQVRQLSMLELSFLRGVPIAVAASSIDADVRAGKQVVLTSVMAMADYRLVKEPNVSVMTEERGDAVGNADVLYVHQAASGKRTPPARPGFALETNKFMDGMFVAGFKVANTPAAYNYARYVRIAPDAGPSN
jgi:hypothetical protein